jgi:cysteine desulfurase
LGVDFLTIAGHKFYAPTGVGALYVRSGIQLEPLIHGAGQESGFRSGTENTAFAVALGKACELAHQELTERESQLRELRNYFQSELLKYFGNSIVINGHPERRLPNTLHVSFRNVTGVDLLGTIPELAASTGAACHSGMIHLSATLKAMKIAPEIGAGSIRFSLGRYTTRQEIERAVELLRQNYHTA